MHASEEWAYGERCAGLRDDDVLGLEELTCQERPCLVDALREELALRTGTDALATQFVLIHIMLGAAKRDSRLRASRR